MTNKQDTNTTLLLAKKDVFLCFFFIFFWLVPVSYIGLTNKDIPFLHRTYNYWARISFLFHTAVEYWPLFYIEVKEENSLNWEDLDDSDYFTMKASGHQNRINRLFTRTHYSYGYSKFDSQKYERYQELAEWIAKRYVRLHPDRPKLKEIRFVRAVYRTEKRAVLYEVWQRPPLAYFPRYFKKVVSTHNVGKVYDTED